MTQDQATCGAHLYMYQAVQDLGARLDKVIGGNESIRADLTQLTISVESIKRVHERIDVVDTTIKECRKELLKEIESLDGQVGEHERQINKWLGALWIASAPPWVITLLVYLFKNGAPK